MAVTMTDVEARRRIGEVLRQVAETQEPVIVEWGGRTRVAIVPYEDDDQDQRRIQLREWLQEADRVAALIAATLGDQPLPDIDELIDGGRDERDESIIANLH